MYKMKFFIHNPGEMETFTVEERSYFNMNEAAAMAQTIAMVLNNYCLMECSYLIVKEEENNIPEDNSEENEEEDEYEDEESEEDEKDLKLLFDLMDRLGLTAVRIDDRSEEP